MKLTKSRLHRIIREAKSDQEKLDKYEGILWDLENSNKLSNPSTDAKKKEKIASMKKKIASLKKKLNESPNSRKTMKLTKRQLKRIIKEEKAKLQENEYAPYGQPGYDPDAESESMEQENTRAHKQLESSLQTLCDIQMAGSVADIIIQALSKCNDGQSVIDFLAEYE